MDVRTVTDKNGLEVTLAGRTAYAIIEERGVYAIKDDNASEASLATRGFSGYAFARFDTREQARADLADILRSQAQKETLGREDIPHDYKRTPWGAADSATRYGDGVVSYGTPGHGGFNLDRNHNALVPASLRSEGGWYEEDSEWAVVAYAFPKLFTDRECRKALESLKSCRPDEMSALLGEPVQPHESRTLRQRIFNRENADRFVVVSASRNGDDVDCVAVRGGRDAVDGERRSFKVPAAEYRIGEFGFVIDEARHDEIVEPAHGMR